MEIIVDRTTGEVIATERELDLDAVAMALVGPFLRWLADQKEEKAPESGAR